jgi:hypothetical protein
MSDMIIRTEILSNIANKIRMTSPYSSEMTPIDMPSRISDIESVIKDYIERTITTTRLPFQSYTSLPYLIFGCCSY